ncbi:acyl-CoA thioesterase [bacterium]|nr:acyl-CoA thioesterase [bacterium]
MRRSVVLHRVPFFETDAMGIVHHANYVRWLELARVAWMDEHDRPYREWVAQGFHFATTRVVVDYRRAVAFDDRVAIATWLDWVAGASLAMAYEIDREGERVATARTEHALVGTDGRPRRLPAPRRAGLEALAASRGRQREARRAKTT